MTFSKVLLADLSLPAFSPHPDAGANRLKDSFVPAAVGFVNNSVVLYDVHHCVSVYLRISVVIIVNFCYIV